MTLLRWRWAGVPASSIHFDQGNQEANLALLKRLREKSAEAGLTKSPRLFLAGDLYRARALLSDTTIEAPAIIKSTVAASGAAPRRIESSALQDICRRIGYRPTSLHDSLLENQGHTTPRRGVADQAVRQRIDAAYATLERSVAMAKANSREHRAPRDALCKKHSGALASATLPQDRTVVLVSNRDGVLDTAFIDASLIEHYAKSRKIDRIVIGKGVLLPELSKIHRRCRKWRLDLFH